MRARGYTKTNDDNGNHKIDDNFCWKSYLKFKVIAA